VDEFTAVAAISQRQGLLPGVTGTTEEPLRPVANLEAVRQYSVIPFGIRDPVPVYHDILYGVVQVLPVTDWTVRLPSLLAGLACIVIMFLFSQAMLGTEVGLVAAAVVALDPVQIAVSALARPYALANLVCLLSFAVLWGLLKTPRPAVAVLFALVYGLCLMALGYFSPVQLMVVAAQAGVMVFGLLSPATGRAWRTLTWLGGIVLGVLLMAPEFRYWGELWQFSRAHTSYLLALEPIRLLEPFLKHNAALLVGLLVIPLAAALVRWQVQGGAARGAGQGKPEEDQTAGTSPEARQETVQVFEDQSPLENSEAVWIGRLWVFIPQLIAVSLAYVAAVSIFQSRFLSYTSLGAALILAYFATRERSREVRLGVVTALVVVLLVLGFWPDWSAGVGLSGNRGTRHLTDILAGPRMESSWEKGDVILLRSGLPEADLLHSDILRENRGEVERMILAPLTTLYPDRVQHPVLVLTLSHYHNGKVAAAAGIECRAQLQAYYNSDFAGQVRKFRRYWMTGLAPGMPENTPYNSPDYLACFLPWLADTLRWDLDLARNRGTRTDPDHYVRVPTDIRAADDIDGLTYGVDRRDFESPLHIVRQRQPGGIFVLGCLAQAGQPRASLPVLGMLMSQNPTPRHRVDPSRENVVGTKEGYGP
jgi:4-amino-4-deoxy-L-arabinose transferase-like glycosyltransferase